MVYLRRFFDKAPEIRGSQFKQIGLKKDPETARAKALPFLKIRNPCHILHFSMTAQGKQRPTNFVYSLQSLNNSLPKLVLISSMKSKEILTLQEKRKNSKTGDIKTAFLPTKDMIKFTFKSFSKIFAPDYVLATGTNGWDKLVDSIEVRNRLTHPKNVSGFDVTRDEFRNAKNAAIWFQEQSTALVNQAFIDRPRVRL